MFCFRVPTPLQCHVKSMWANLLTSAVIALSVLLQSGRPDVVCDIGFKLCDAECYDPTTLHCLESDGYKIVCPLEMKACGVECYSDGVCFQSNGNGISVPCQAGQQQCGHQCFSPSEEKCVGDGGDGSIACGIDDGVCGTGKHAQCFKPSKSVCTAHGRVCNHGQESCGHECYKPTNSITCFGGRILCHDGRKLCGDGHDCYSEEFNETCVNSLAVCRIGETLCGEDRCYDPNDKSIKCIKQEGSNIGVLCPVEQDICEGKCYDKNLHTCFPFRGLGLICPNGQIGCGGTDCYTANTPAEDSLMYQCLRNDAGEEVLCRIEQSLCGNVCFSSTDQTGVSLGFKCVKNPEGLEILCREEEEVCGNACYDPQAQICHPTP